MPLASDGRGQKHWITKQDVGVEVGRAGGRRRQSSEDEVDTAFAQFRVLVCECRRRKDLEDSLRILPRKPINNHGDKAAEHGVSRAKPDFAGAWIGKCLDFLHGLAQIVKNCNSPLYQRPAVERWLDALWGPIEKPHADNVFNLANGL